MAQDQCIIIPIDVDQPPSSTKHLIERHWAEKKQLPIFKLKSPEDSLTGAFQAFLSNESSTFLIELTETKFWTKNQDQKSAELVTIIPLIPMPLVISKLYAKLVPNSLALQNSFDMIRNVQNAYKEALKISKLSKDQREAIEMQREKVLQDMLVFTSNTLARLFVRNPTSSVFLNMFMRELYYTTVNIIRVYEFSILDLIGIPEKFQTPFVIPFETDLASWKETTLYSPEIIDSTMKKSLIESYNLVQSEKMNVEKDLEGEWPSMALISKHYLLCKKTVNSNRFNCGNYDSCHNRENVAKNYGACSKCKWTRYCSPTCQQAHWKSKHKRECCQELNEDDCEQIFKGRRIIIGAEAESEAEPTRSSVSPSSSAENTVSSSPNASTTHSSLAGGTGK